MAVKTQFTAKQRTRSRGPTGRVTAKGKPASNHISIEGNT